MKDNVIFAMIINIMIFEGKVDNGCIYATDCFKNDVKTLESVLHMYGSNDCPTITDVLKAFRIKAGLKGVSMETLKDYFMPIIQGINE